MSAYESIGTEHGWTDGSSAAFRGLLIFCVARLHAGYMLRRPRWKVEMEWISFVTKSNHITWSAINHGCKISINSTLIKTAMHWVFRTLKMRLQNEVEDKNG